MHSHIHHLKALLETAKEQSIPHVFIHFFGDGRDTAPKSAAGYARDLQAFIDKEGVGRIATVVGRYYAMDRDKRWERVKIAIDGLVKGEGEAAEDVAAAIEARYEKGETDEFLKPIIFGGDETRIKGMWNTWPYGASELTGCSRRRHALLVQLPFGPNARARERVWPAGQAHGGGHPEGSRMSTLPRPLCSTLTWRSAHFHHVALQRRVHVPRRLPAAADDECARRVACQKGSQASAHCRYAPCSPHLFYIFRTATHSRAQRRRSMRTSRSSSTVAWRSSSRTRSGTSSSRPRSPRTTSSRR